MTSQTKHLIELDDIISFEFECRSCGATIMVPLASEVAFVTPRECIHCHNELIGYDSKAPDFFRDLLRNMRLIRQHLAEKRVGFVFKMGLKSDPRDRISH